MDNDVKELRPQKPAHLDPLAIEMLERLQAVPDSAIHVVLGGGVALQHYLPFRGTHDVDAWWARASSRRDREETIGAIRAIANEVAERHGLTVAERPPGDVVSIELQRSGKTIFSFQVAARDIELEPPLIDDSPWAPVPIETLTDNLASKMTALVSRGAPRDFVDVYQVTRAGIVTPTELWDFWQAKHPGQAISVAKAQAARHLASIEMRRPIEMVPDRDREAVAALRGWVRSELVRIDPRHQELVDMPRSAREGRTDDGGLEL